jgi:hypothetical protein
MASDPLAADVLRIVLPPEPACYRPKDASATTRLSRPKISLAIKHGELRAMKLDGCVVIPRESLQAWLDEHARPIEGKRTA